MPDPVLQRGDSSSAVAVAQGLLNRSGAILDDDGKFGPGTERAVREFQALVGLPVMGIIDASSWQELRKLPEPSPDIPTKAVVFICREEVSSREEYDRANCRPTWPGGRSGVTIGIGYDLGQQSNFAADWSDLLTDAQMIALKPWVKVMGARAAKAPATLAQITIPWQAAWVAFIRRTLPEQVALTRKVFKGQMPPLCLGALVSLVYNRGGRMKDTSGHPGDRQEMRDIRDAIASGKLQDIPAALRNMTRLWPTVAGLRARRQREAELFEGGLKENGLAKGAGG